MFEPPTWVDRSVPKPEDLVEPIYVSTAAQARARAEALGTRNAKADAAWDEALEPARLRLGHPDRVPYPEAVKDALRAYDEVMAAWR